VTQLINTCDESTPGHLRGTTHCDQVIDLVRFEILTANRGEKSAQHNKRKDVRCFLDAIAVEFERVQVAVRCNRSSNRRRQRTRTSACFKRFFVNEQEGPANACDSSKDKTKACKAQG